MKIRLWIQLFLIIIMFYTISIAAEFLTLRMYKPLMICIAIVLIAFIIGTLISD